MNENQLIELDGEVAKYDDITVEPNGWVSLKQTPYDGIAHTRKVPPRRVTEIVTWNAEQPEPFADPLYTATMLRQFANLVEGELQIEDSQLAKDAVSTLRLCSDLLEDEAKIEGGGE